MATWRSVRYAEDGTKRDATGRSWSPDVPQMGADELAAALSDGATLALLPETLGLVVLDIDCHNGESLADVMETAAALEDAPGSGLALYAAKTRSGGLHLYFRAAPAPYVTKLDGFPCPVDIKRNGLVYWHEGNDINGLLDAMERGDSAPWLPSYAVRRPVQPSTGGKGGNGTFSLPRAAEALRAIARSRELSHDDWIRYGMALHSEDASHAAMLAWHDATKRHDGDTLATSARRWASFRSGGGVTFASVVADARQAGYDYHPPKDTPAFPVATGAAPTCGTQPVVTEAGSARRTVSVAASRPEALLAALEATGGTVAKDHALRPHLRHPEVTSGAWRSTEDQAVEGSLLRWFNSRCHVDGKPLDATHHLRGLRVAMWGAVDVFHPLVDHARALPSAPWPEDDAWEFLRIYAPPLGADAETWRLQAITANRLAWCRLMLHSLRAEERARAHIRNAGHTHHRPAPIPHLLIAGPGGVGKTRFAEEMLPVPLRGAYYGSIRVGDDAGEVERSAVGRLVCELAELDLSTPAAAADVPFFKSLLVDETRTVRLKYAREAQNHPMPALFVATTNVDRPLPEAYDDALQRRFAGLRVDAGDTTDVAGLLHDVRDARLAAALRDVEGGSVTWSSEDVTGYMYSEFTKRGTDDGRFAFLDLLPDGFHPAAALRERAGRDVTAKALAAVLREHPDWSNRSVPLGRGGPRAWRKGESDEVHA